MCCCTVPSCICRFLMRVRVRIYGRSWGSTSRIRCTLKTSTWCRCSESAKSAGTCSSNLFQNWVLSSLRIKAATTCIFSDFWACRKRRNVNKAAAWKCNVNTCLSVRVMIKSASSASQCNSQQGSRQWLGSILSHPYVATTFCRSRNDRPSPGLKHRHRQRKRTRNKLRSS